MMENPFEVLRLSPDATLDEAVQQAARLSRIAPDESSRNRIRQAIQQLTATPESWLLAALLAHPRPDYHHPELDRFVAKHRRSPVDRAMSRETPFVDWEELRRLRESFLATGFSVPGLPLEPLDAECELGEREDQSFEHGWRDLRFQPGA